MLETPVAWHVETVSQVIPISGFKYFFEYRKVASTIILGVDDWSGDSRGTALSFRISGVQNKVH
jgi:hypothetical protein